jgi:two-component system alkaline phosphatase synthesis response regulator PhoP
LPKLLIVEDEPAMALALRDNCEFEGYQVEVAGDGEQAIRTVLESPPDLILLDVMLPRLSGLDVCRRLRRQGVAVPIIMLTARGGELDKVAALDLGADDYVTKPFGIAELMARIRAQLRRSLAAAALPDSCKFGAMEVDFRNHRAQRNGAAVALSPREFEILRYLVAHRGEVVTREQLMKDVWRINGYPLTRTIDNHIAKLRQKIEGDGAPYLVTIHRVGYKFLG